MHMKNLASVLSASETLGRTFRRDSLVHLTCVGVEAGKHVDGASIHNLLKVTPWRGHVDDCELQVAQSYMQHLLHHQPQDVRAHLRMHRLEDFRDISDWLLCE